MQEISNAANSAIASFVNERYGGDSFGGGERIKARLKKLANNPVSQKKRKIANTIKLLADREGKPEHEISLQLLKKESPVLRNYLRKKGIKPAKDLVSMAIQADQAREADVKAVSKKLDIPAQDAEVLLENSEAELFTDNNADADEFLGGIVAAVKNVAKEGLSRIAEKKKAKGKKGLFVQLDNKINQGKTPEQVKDNETHSDKKGVLGFFDSLFKGVKTEEKKKEIKKMLPLIIGGVLVLVLLTVLITRAATKK